MVMPSDLSACEIGNLGVEAAGGKQPLSQIHVVVMVHHLVAGQRLVAIAVRQREHLIERAAARRRRWRNRYTGMRCTVPGRAL